MLRRIVLVTALSAVVVAGTACAPDNPKTSTPPHSTGSTEPPLNSEPPSSAPSPATVSITTTIPPSK